MAINMLFRLMLTVCCVFVCTNVFAVEQSTNQDIIIYSPSNEYFISSKLSGSNEKIYFCLKSTGKQNLIYEQEIWNNKRCKITWHTNWLVEVNSTYGNPGSCSIFYSVKNGTNTDCFDFPIIFNKENNLLLTADNEVCIVNIFYPKKKYCLALNFYDTIVKWIIIDKTTTRFDRFGNLTIKYQNSANEWKEELIPFKEFSRLVD